MYVLGALLAGGLLPMLYQVMQRWRRGPLEDSELIARTVNDQLGGMRDLIGQYRIELEVAKKQLEDYRAQLTEVTRDLARAQMRISQLEEDLKSARRRRDDMERELDQLRVHYELLVRERSNLEDLTRTLAEKMKAAE